MNQNSTSMLAGTKSPPGGPVRVVKKHHLLGALSTGLNVPILSASSQRHSFIGPRRGLSTQARSDYGNFDVGGLILGIWICAIYQDCSLQQSHPTGLQPHEPRAGHVGFGPWVCIVVRVLIHAEWHGCLAGWSWEEGGLGRAFLFAAPPAGQSV